MEIRPIIARAGAVALIASMAAGVAPAVYASETVDPTQAVQTYAANPLAKFTAEEQAALKTSTVQTDGKAVDWFKPGTQTEYQVKDITDISYMFGSGVNAKTLFEGAIDPTGWFDAKGNEVKFADRAKATVYQYSLKGIKSGATVTYTFTKTASTPAKPDLSAFKTLKFTDSNGKTIAGDWTKATKGEYTGDAAKLTVSGTPSGWKSAKNVDAKTGVVTFTLTKGTEKVVYTFTKTASTPAKPDLSAFKTLKFTDANGKTIAGDWTTTTKGEYTGDAAKLTVSGEPSGWKAVRAVDAKTGIVTFTLTKGTEKVVYTFTKAADAKPESKPITVKLTDLKGGLGIRFTATGKAPTKSDGTNLYPNWEVAGPGVYTLTYDASRTDSAQSAGILDGTVYTGNTFANDVASLGRADPTRAVHLRTSWSNATKTNFVSQTMTFREGDVLALPVGGQFGSITLTPQGSATPTVTYSATELKNVTATVNDKPVAGFNPISGGTFKVAPGSFVQVRNLPAGWTHVKTSDPKGQWIKFDVYSPDRKVHVVYRFVSDTALAADRSDRNAKVDAKAAPAADTNAKAAPAAPDRLAQTGVATGSLGLLTLLAGSGIAVALRRRV